MAKARKNAYGGRKEKRMYPIPSNLSKLKGAMREHGMTLESVAVLLGHSVNYVRTRLNGDFPFGVDEAIALQRAMDLSPEETTLIFLGIRTESVHRRGA